MQDRIQLSPTPESVAAARQWSVRQSSKFGLSSLSDTVALLVSEMVTNVVVHARTTCELSMRTTSRYLRVELRDRSSQLPTAKVEPDQWSVSGRGMSLIEGLSESCGADLLPGGGKVVWFQLANEARTA